MNRNILLKGIIAAITVFYVCLSCEKQETEKLLSVEKLYIIEHNYFINSDNNQSTFRVFGFSELDKDFKSTYAIYGHNGFYYCHPDIIVPDSLRNRISEILIKYDSDTTFLPKQRTGFYDGNHYLFIIQKNKKEVNIKFEPEFLPDDLLFLYNNLYGNNKDSFSVDKFDGLFKEFEKRIPKEAFPLIFTDPLIISDTI